MRSFLVVVVVVVATCFALYAQAQQPKCYVSPSGVQFPDSEGFCNNLANPQWGAIGHTLTRTNTQGLKPVSKGGMAQYADGIGQMITRQRSSVISTRAITNILIAQCDCHNEYSTDQIRTDLFTYFGQFTTHDLVITPFNGNNPNMPGVVENAPIAVPADDAFFTDYTTVVPFTRSDVVPGTGATTPRENPNSRTSYMDLSEVYGVNTAVTNLIRSFTGGQLLMDTSGSRPYLPRVRQVCSTYATRVGDSSGTAYQSCVDMLGLATKQPFAKMDNMMVAGDPRINDQFGLLSYHHLWALNHNYWANKLAQQNPSKGDEELFHLARQYNVAEFQSIAYNQFLPLLLGDVYNPVYPGYSADVDASANQEFLGGCMRWGHTAISPLLLRRTVDNELIGGDTFIRDAFFQPDRFVLYNGYESVLYGLMYQRMQQVDINVGDARRNFLYGPGDPSLGLDLTAINIQRGRDQGILSFNDVRRAYGLTPYTSFSDVVGGNQALANALSSVYASVEDCDLFVCGIAEMPHVNNGVLGRTFASVINDQFSRTRQGDRFYFENLCQQNLIFSQSDCANIRAVRLQDILTRHLSKPVTWNPFLPRPETMDSLCTSNPQVVENYLANNSASTLTYTATLVLVALAAVLF